MVNGSDLALLSFWTPLLDVGTHVITFHHHKLILVVLLSVIPYTYVLDSKGQDASPVVFTASLLTVGGRNQSDKHVKTDEICAFDPANCLWLPIGNILVGRSRIAVVAVAENRIVCFGGDMKPTTEQEYSKIA